MKLTRISLAFGRRLGPNEFIIDFQGNGPGKLVMRCPVAYGECSVSLTRGDPDYVKRIHGWDGNFDAPTIKPSIGCDIKPRCGWHGIITAGERVP